jgi:hypothetical protein
MGLDPRASLEEFSRRMNGKSDVRRIEGAGRLILVQYSKTGRRFMVGGCSSYPVAEATQGRRRYEGLEKCRSKP